MSVINIPCKFHSLIAFFWSWEAISSCLCKWTIDSLERLHLSTTPRSRDRNGECPIHFKTRPFIFRIPSTWIHPVYMNIHHLSLDRFNSICWPALKSRIPEEVISAWNDNDEPEDDKWDTLIVWLPLVFGVAFISWDGHTTSLFRKLSGFQREHFPFVMATNLRKRLLPKRGYKMLPAFEFITASPRNIHRCRIVLRALWLPKRLQPEMQVFTKDTQGIRNMSPVDVQFRLLSSWD